MKCHALIARWAYLLGGAIFIVSFSHLAFAQISEYDEPPAKTRPALIRLAPDRSPVKFSASSAPAPVLAVRTAAPVPSSRQPSPVARRGGEFTYSVRAGDSLGSIAATFGLQPEDLARANRIDIGTVLMVGRTLRIPNPFAAQMRTLNAQVDTLKAEMAESDEKAAAANLKTRTLMEKTGALADQNSELRGEVSVLPRWRGTAVTLGIIALLMFGVILVTVIEWWLLRRRFIALSDTADSLSQLDRKYKLVLAKAELRYQQLYGRRRVVGAADALQHGKTAEEIELDRLNRDLRETLEFHLHRLGVARMRKRRRPFWRDVFGEVESPVEAGSARR
ncbi:MAG: LysM peptidoglycan-binding domain-containing protein [Candidatus Binataceae bacterium]|nr:LysM peptidoglycan-binding domain-containing protein [Candidatus Binataceae bacterium]